MERKVVQHGPSTLMISLPSKWVKKKGLKKGDELDVEQKENNLIISLDKRKQKTEINLDLSSLEESSVRTILTNIYRLGYDKITINYQNNKILEIIKTLVEKNLLGFEITEKTATGCKIESITEPAMDQFENIFSKVLINIDELFAILEETFTGQKRDFEDIDRKIQQFDNFCRRVLVKNSLFENNFLQWTFHSELIHATREIYHLLNYLSYSKVKISKYEFEMLKETKKVFEIIRESYNKRDIHLLEKVHELEKEATYRKGYEALKKTENSIIVFHLMLALKHFYLTNSPLMGIIMQNK